MQNLKLRKAGLVTDSLHIHRARYLFQRHFNNLKLQLHPLPAPGLYTDYWRRGRTVDKLGIGDFSVGELTHYVNEGLAKE